MKTTSVTPKQPIEKIGTDLKEYLKDNVQDMAESHLYLYKDRYCLYSLASLKVDLYLNHDISLEIESVENGLERKLNDKEQSFVKDQFNKTVIKIKS